MRILLVGLLIAAVAAIVFFGHNRFETKTECPENECTVQPVMPKADEPKAEPKSEPKVEEKPKLEEPKKVEPKKKERIEWPNLFDRSKGVPRPMK